MAVANAQGETAPATDALALIARAEVLTKQRETEDAVITAWRAVELLATTPDDAVHGAATRSVRELLAEHDPRDARRRTTFAAAAKQLGELAAAYRGRRWLVCAADSLQAAERFDRATVAKERTALAALQRQAGAATAAPARAAGPADKRPCELLQPAAAYAKDGDWTVVGDTLQGQPPMGQSMEWITKAEHADHEVVVEFRPLQPAEDHNAALTVGAVYGRDGAYDAYRFQFDHHKASKQSSLVLWAIRGDAFEHHGTIQYTLPPSTDGFRRFAVQVRGNRLRARIDQGKPFEFDAPRDVRGKIGLVLGISDAGTCPVQFRNLRIDPLPADEPTDEQLRQHAAATTQNEITRLAAEADALLAQKQPESATLRLRAALDRVRALDAGSLRDNLQRSLDAALAKADPLAGRRAKLLQSIASELLALAEEHAKAGWSGAALALAEDAVALDPAGTAAPAQAPMQQWRAAIAAARAAALQPPADDGAMLRDWFAAGRVTRSRARPFVCDGAEAFAELAPNSSAEWLPRPDAPRCQTAHLHLHLPAHQCEAGLLVDFVRPDDHALVRVTRGKDDLTLTVQRCATGKWTTLQTATVPLAAWRLDAWHALAVRSTPTGITAKLGDVELVAARAQLGEPTGALGLYADNHGTAPARVAVRAFRAEP